MVSSAADSDSDDAQDDDDRDLEEIHNQALAQLMWPGSPVPRSYQVEAFRQVCEKNTIVSMDTGLGKTLIAVMCIDFYLKRNPSKKVLMCVPTVQLAKQQAAYIQSTSTVPEIKVADVTGGTIPATRERWTQLLDIHQVVVATGQLAKQAIAEWCYLSLEQLSLLILDECHHAVGRDPVASLMQEPKAWKQSGELPRVLGLTASYLHGRSTDFQGRRQRLEATLRSQLWCADDLQADLQRHRSEQTFETLSYREGSSEFRSLRQRCCEELEDLLQAYTRDDSGPLWECRQDIDRLIEKAERAFNQAGFYGWLAFVKTKILPAVHERFREKEQDRWRVAEAEAAWDALRPANSVAASGKLEKLVELLEEFQGAENDANRILVFVAQVDDAYSLAVTINRYLDKPVAKYLSGVNSMTPAEQQKALKAFSDGTDPVMVATPALEEGIDVPSCNVVIRYDAFHTAKSHIQGAGRARKKDARIFYFENNWEEEEAVRDLMKQAAQQPFEPLKEEAARDAMKQAAQRPTESPKDLSEPERLLARELAVEVLPRGVSKSKARRPPRDAPAEDFSASESTSLTIPHANGTSGARVDVGHPEAYPLILQELRGSMQVDAYNCVAILQEFVERSDKPAFPIFAREEGIIVRCAAPTKPEIAVTEEEVAEYWRQVSNNSGESSIFDFVHWLDPDRYQRWSWDETQQHRFAMVVVSRLAQDSQLEGRNRPSDYALGMWPPDSQEERKDPFDENDPWMDAIHTRNGDKAWNKDPFDENDPWMDAIHARDGDKDSTTASRRQYSWQQQSASDWKDESNWWSSRGSRDHRSSNTERDRHSWWQRQGGSSWWQQDNSYAHWDGEKGGDSWSRWTQFESPAPKATAGPWRPKEDEESARGSASRTPADRKRREPEKVAADSLPTPAPAKLSGGSGSSGGTKDAKPARAILNEFLMAYAGRNLSKGGQYA
ncbi:DCL3A [Symbiodinium sp. CCMP2592]|nr:DCL3A [Symbiodinium sp. CCMP2592]